VELDDGEIGQPEGGRGMSGQETGAEAAGGPAVQRFGSVVRLRPEKREEYLRLHSAVWPGVEKTIKDSNIGNYTIFLHGDLLFAYFEYHGTDAAADLARIGEDEETRRWWELTDPCQERLPDAAPGQQWSDAVELWHLD
jgi:L-rhamnose mutarotase